MDFSPGGGGFLRVPIVRTGEHGDLGGEPEGDLGGDLGGEPDGEPEGELKRLRLFSEPEGELKRLGLFAFAFAEDSIFKQNKCNNKNR